MIKLLSEILAVLKEIRDLIREEEKDPLRSLNPHDPRNVKPMPPGF